MKVWLDDIRPAPRGWRRARRPDEVIRFLKTGKVTELSLDHDLGGDDDGYRVVTWIEEQVVRHGLTPPWPIKVHSANTSAVPRMEAGIRSLYRRWQKNKERQMEKQAARPPTAGSKNRGRRHSS